MPTGPKGEKRPADAIGLAVKIARIATGEDQEALPIEAKQKAGKVGAKARAKALTPQQRSEIAHDDRKVQATIG
jgi:hypothetical protein